MEKDKDFYIDQNGNVVFTREYHLKRGHCCKNGCLNCPYGFTITNDPNTPIEFCLASNYCSEDFEKEDQEEDE